MFHEFLRSSSSNLMLLSQHWDLRRWWQVTRRTSWSYIVNWILSANFSLVKWLRILRLCGWTREDFSYYLMNSGHRVLSFFNFSFKSHKPAFDSSSAISWLKQLIVSRCSRFNYPMFASKKFSLSRPQCEEHRWKSHKENFPRNDDKITSIN